MASELALPAIVAAVSLGAILVDKYGNPLKKATDFIKSLEGRDGYLGNGNYRAVADIGGVPTIGYGSTVHPDGSPVKAGETCTETQAIAYLQSEVKKHLDTITKNTQVKLSNGQIVALTSFAYNVGDYALLHSGLWSRTQAGEDKKAVVGEFMKWVFVKGNYVQGLANRRKTEQTMFLS